MRYRIKKPSPYEAQYGDLPLGNSGDRSARWQQPQENPNRLFWRVTAVLRRMERNDITVHGFRSSFRDWCSESVANSFPREVCEHALAHSLPDKVEAAYRRGDLIEKRALLMQAWSDYCATIQPVAKVTQIRGKTLA